MKKIINILRYIGLTLTLAIVISACQKNIEKPADTTSLNDKVEASSAKDKNPKSLKDFVQVNLVGDNNEFHPARMDANLVNGWGITFPPSGPAWVSAEVTGKSLVLNGEGIPSAISPVNIPGAGNSAMGHPTGVVFNGSASDFKLPNGNPARFIFAGSDGVISGWNGGPAAIEKVDDSPDASYLGITIAASGNDHFLYVANFAEKEINVYDTGWHEIQVPFVDPDLPSSYSPFDIQNIDGKLFVMYAKLDPATGDEVHAPGAGIIDIYNPDGSFVRRFVSHGQLNAPWGIAEAPRDFWGHDSDKHDSDMEGIILVGNFGDGHINAYDARGSFIGQLRAHGNPIRIEGLWGIAFAPPTSTVINHNRLYFAAGPDDETHGLFGYISK